MATKKKAKKKNERLFIALEVEPDKDHAAHGTYTDVFVNGTVDCLADHFGENAGNGDEHAVYELKLVGYLTKGEVTFNKV